MANSIKITIKGSNETGIDAPTVEDFLGQVHDFLAVLQNVEKAVSEDGKNELVWRVTHAQMNSPICFEVTPFPKNPAIYIDARAAQVERVAMEGIVAIKTGDQYPPYFNKYSMAKTRAIYARVMNGLADTSFSFGPAIAPEPVIIDRNTARNVEAFYQAALATQPAPYRELGSVEGFVSKAERGDIGCAILRFHSRLDGTEIKAIAEGRAFQQLEALRLSDVWEGVRVRVYGTIWYHSLGAIKKIDATGIEVLDQSPLPNMDNIIDENFTNGVISENYLAALRSV